MEKPDSELSAVLTQFMRDPRNARNAQRLAQMTESDEPARRELGFATLLTMLNQPAGGARGRRGGGEAQQSAAGQCPPTRRKSLGQARHYDQPAPRDRARAFGYL